MALDDVNIDYGLSGAGSYQSRQPGVSGQMSMDGFSGQTRDISNLSPGTTEFGMDTSTANYINQNITNRLIAATPEEQLGSSAYYPLGNEPIAVGEFSGPLGSVSLMSAGAPEIPYDLLYAKQRAKQKQELELQEKLNAQVQFEYAEIKDNIRNSLFIDRQRDYYANMMQEKFADYEKKGVHKEFWSEMFEKDPDFKVSSLQWKNKAAAFDKYYDEAVSVVNEWESGNINDFIGLKAYNEAKSFLNQLVKTDVSNEDLMSFDPEQFSRAMSVYKAADQTMKMAEKKLLDNQTMDIYNAMQAGKIGLADIKNTNKEDVYLLATKIGLDKTRIEELAKADYQVAYGRAIEKYGNKSSDYVPDFDKDFLPYYEKLVHESLSLAIDKVANDRLGAQRLAWEKEQDQKRRTVITPNTKSYFVTGANGKQFEVKWGGDITTSKGTGAYIPVAGVNNVTVLIRQMEHLVSKTSVRQILLGTEKFWIRTEIQWMQFVS